MGRRDIGGELLTALIIVGVLALALIFGLVLTLSRSITGIQGTPQPTNDPTLLASFTEEAQTRSALVLTGSSAAGATGTLTVVVTRTPFTPTTQAPTTAATATITSTRTHTAAPTQVPPTATALPSDTPRATDAAPQPAASASVTSTAAPSRTRTPTTTPTVRASNTPTRTLTAVPPSATATRMPSMTFTATATPTATRTRTPLPTNTPLPSSTPLPTYTPLPSNTPLPTSTPVPTKTPLPTVVAVVYSPTPTLFVPTLPAPFATATTTCDRRADWVPYVIKPGETLFSIAMQARVTVRELQRANCIDDPNRISVGQVIVVPPGRAIGGTAISGTPQQLIGGVNAVGCDNPAVRIAAPQPGSTVNGVITIVGSAIIADFSFYKLELRNDADPNWVTFISSPIPVENGQLGTLNTDLFEPGVYWIQVLAVDKTSNYPIPPCAVRLRFG